MTESTQEQGPPEKPPGYMGLGITIGMALGAAIGAVTGAMAVALGSGLTLGIGLGVLFSKNPTRKRQSA